MPYAKLKRNLIGKLITANTYLLHRAGYDVVRYETNPINRRIKLLQRYQIDLVLDVGANIGQYAKQMRRLGYKKKIVSFEPLHSAFTMLSTECSLDDHWEGVNIGLGDYDGDTEINIARRSVRSSILNMSAERFQFAPNVGTKEYMGKEEIRIRKIDSIIDDYYSGSERIFLKMDVQGYEKHVLRGAAKSFDKITGIQTELSLLPLYEGETTLVEMIKYINDKGFLLESLEPGFYNSETGRLLQVDGIFFRAR